MADVLWFHMDRNHALSVLREAEPVLRARYGVTSAGLFGSVARGDSDDASDIDVVVRFANDRVANVMAICGIAGLLSSRFGVDVDVVAEPVTTPALKQAIGRDVVHAF